MKLSLGITPRDYSAAGGITYDADALAYFTANTAITSAADKNAINTFYLGLKSDGIYTKMKAMYLPIWGSAASSKWNLKDPRDLDAAFRLTFTTGWTYSSGGITPNGTSAYANTILNLNLTQTSSSSHLSYYSRTFENSASGEIGSSDASTNANTLYLSYNGTAYCYNGLSKNVTVTGQTNQTKGFYLANANANSLKLFKNALQLGSTTALTSYITTNFNIYLGAINISNTASLFSSKQCSFASIGNGLTDTEASNFYTRVNTLMTYFGINV